MTILTEYDSPRGGCPTGLVNKNYFSTNSVFLTAVRSLISAFLIPKARILDFQKTVLTRVLLSLRFLPTYYRTNECVWQEGLLIDWLQKKIFDKWVRRFLVHSSYLVSERVIFDIVVRCYIDYVVWPLHSSSIFDFRSVSKLLLFLACFVALSLVGIHLLTLLLMLP